MLAVLGGAAVMGVPGIVRGVSHEPIRFGLTPVFLSSDLQLLTKLEQYLASAVGEPVALVQRRTYQEISSLLLAGQLDAAWICGFPYVQHVDRLSLLAVPVFRGEPLYQSYVIVNKESPARAFEDLRGGVHAFSDPDSNSGFLVTRHMLATMKEAPEGFFARTFFTYGHRNVIRAVASGLAQSGSVDGYVWDVMSETDPDLVERTRILRRSEKLGFPPVASSARLASSPQTGRISRALMVMHEDQVGRSVLGMLRLDRFIVPSVSLFDGIAEK
ncbi:MAG: phosphonate ABC transporter substrate-binding protein, partial [Alphaproteobacteria bacterium]|nr:phosphonate ABC transporter substrate-binding protein [Alphaproteobacteria bacterium]